MQTDTKALIRQQLILRQLGFYTGPLDGIWGPVSIEAMKKFENRLELFRPARPKGGLPFSDSDKLPRHFYWEPAGLLCHDESLNGTVEVEENALLQSGGRPKRRSTKFGDKAQPEQAQGDLKIEVEEPSKVPQSKGNGQQHHKHGKHNQHQQRRNEDDTGEDAVESEDQD